MQRSVLVLFCFIHQPNNSKEENFYADFKSMKSRDDEIIKLVRSGKTEF